jgi:thioredoxin-like negative regulator of GroEL
VAARPTRPLPALLLGLGLALGASGGCASAVAVAPMLERGEAALAAGEAEDAADAFQSALALRPGDRRALFGLARSHLARGDGEAALVVFAELRAGDPSHFAATASGDYERALVQAARSRLWRGDPAGALRLLEGLGPQAAVSPAVRDLRARARLVEAGRLQVAGRTREAVELYRQATGIDAGPDPTAALAESLIAEGQVDTAISLLSDGLRRSGGDARLAALMQRALDIRYPDPPPSRPGGAPPEPVPEAEH